MIELATEVRWQDRRFEVPMERIVLSEKVGYDAVFTAEGYGSESLVPLGYIAAHTKRLKLGDSNYAGDRKSSRDGGDGISDAKSPIWR